MRYVPAIHTNAFPNAFGEAYKTLHQSRSVLGKKIKLITTMKDSKSFIERQINSSVVSEKRLMIDLPATCQVHEQSDIAHIGWVVPLKRRE